MKLDVIAAAPSLREVEQAHAGAPSPEVPGAVFLARDEDDMRRLCGGFLPCGACGPCRSTLHLACAAPVRPGSAGEPGGCAGQLELAGEHLAPALDMEEAEDHAGALALVAAAGPVYQAAVLAGAIPGDMVLLPAPLAQDSLVMALLQGMGLRPAPLERPGELPGDLPSPRLHLLDLCPTERSMDAWLPLAPQLSSASLVSPTLPTLRPELTALLAGQATPRWVRDLHPHLVLDLVALARRLDLDGRLDLVSPQALPAAMSALDPAGQEPWPVALLR